jgi:linoleoyl-CoA desaturase
LHPIFFNITIIYIKCFLSIIASSIDTSIFLFNLSHDGSHYAISTNPVVNNTISKIANSWTLWNHSMWFYHHVYYHHSFTGNINDPDKNLYSINLMFDVNKCLSVETIVNIIYTSIPGQLFSQFIWYIYSSFKSRLWLIGIDHFKIPNANHYDIGSLIIMFCKIYVLYNMGILPSICYIITGNTLYYLNVMADHDLYETHENYYDGNDWAKRQICNSGNFVNENRIWTMAFSGINHQIEHHLFPNICGHKCAYIADIVKEFCKENNLPYVHHSTFFGAYNSFMKKLKT